jgi:hypothetical protein
VPPGGVIGGDGNLLFESITPSPSPAAAAAAALGFANSGLLAVVFGALFFLLLLGVCCFALYFVALPRWRRRSDAARVARLRAKAGTDKAAMVDNKHRELLAARLASFAAQQATSKRRRSTAKVGSGAAEAGDSKAGADPMLSDVPNPLFAGYRKSFAGGDRAAYATVPTLPTMEPPAAPPVAAAPEDDVPAFQPPEEAAAPPAQIDPFANLQLPLDPTTAAYMGVDPATGNVTNWAACWAYHQYANGGDYKAWYDYYAAQLTAGASGDAEAGGEEAPAAAAAAPPPKPAGGVAMPGGWRRGAAPTRSKYGRDGAAGSAMQSSRSLAIGEGSLRANVVTTETVKLRKVDSIRGDVTFRGVAKAIMFTAIKEKRQVEVPTDKRAAASELAAAAGGAGGAAAEAGAGEPSGAGAAPGADASPAESAPATVPGSAGEAVSGPVPVP